MFICLSTNNCCLYVQYVWLVAQMIGLVVWKFYMVLNGVRCVMTPLQLKLRRWFVGIWVILEVGDGKFGNQLSGLERFSNAPPIFRTHWSCHGMLCYLLVGTQHSSAHFGAGDGLILMDTMTCGGSERYLDLCSTNWYIENCSHGEDAGVTCSNNNPVGSGKNTNIS